MSEPESVSDILKRIAPNYGMKYCETCSRFYIGEHICVADDSPIAGDLYTDCRCCGKPTPTVHLSPSGECPNCMGMCHN